MAGDDADQQEPAGNTVGAELGEAIGRFIDIHVSRLPVELQSRAGEPGPEQDTKPGAGTRRRPQRQRGGVEAEQKRPCPGAQSQGRRFDADARIILLVLMRVDRVVAERPQNPAEIEQYRQPRGNRSPRPSREGAPVELSPKSCATR